MRETLTNPLGELPPLVEATALAREVEFAYPIGPGAPARGLVKGFIDALVAYGDELWVLDYKSDRLANPARAREHVDDHYGVQARLYALAADRMRGDRRLRGVLFAFVRHGLVVPVAVEDGTLATWAQLAGGPAMIPLHPRGTLRALRQPRRATTSSAGSASARGAAISATRASTSPRRSSRPTAGSAARTSRCSASSCSRS